MSYPHAATHKQAHLRRAFNTADVAAVLTERVQPVG